MLPLKLSIIDFNAQAEIGLPLPAIAQCGGYVYWTNRLCPTDGLAAPPRIPQVCRALPGRAQSAQVFLSRSVLVSRLCATDRSREFARHRSLSARHAAQALPHGISRSHR